MWNEEKQLSVQDKKIKLDDNKRGNNDEASSTTHSPPESSIDVACSEQQIIRLSNDFKGALNANIGISWFNALQEEFDKPYFKKLNDFLEQVLGKVQYNF